MSGERSSGQGCWCGLKVQVDEWGEIIRARVFRWAEGTSWKRESMRDQRLGWDEGTSGERVWGTRGWDGMRVQMERVYEGPEVGMG